MSTPSFLIAAASPAVADWLAPGLRSNDMPVAVYPLDALAKKIGEAGSPERLDAMVDELGPALPPFDALILAPALQQIPDPGGAPEAVSRILSASFALMKAALARFEAAGTQGRLFSVLPVDAVMGDPDDTVNAALAGGMLSLFRTVSMELRRLPVTANTVVMPAPSAGPVAAAGGAAMIRALCAPDTLQVNGQEIYAAGAADVGRLHP